MQADVLSLLMSTKIQMTITLGDLLIVLLIIVLIRQLRLKPESVLYDMLKQAPWLLSLIKYWNDHDAGLRMAVEAIKMMIKDGIITKEQAVEIIAKEIARRRQTLLKKQKRRR